MEVMPEFSPSGTGGVPMPWKTTGNPPFGFHPVPTDAAQGPTPALVSTEGPLYAGQAAPLWNIPTAAQMDSVIELLSDIRRLLKNSEAV